VSPERSTDGGLRDVDARRAAAPSDNPIRLAQDDGLGRDQLAEAFASHVLGLDSAEGLVVGVLGPWGSGKTSFVNLARAHFSAADIDVLDFNPWMFSGAEQLVDSFFDELATQLKIRPRLARVGKELEHYGELFSWHKGGQATRALGGLLQGRKGGLQARRNKVQQKLAELDHPVVVVLDDIDRLTTSEIRDVFKLVRLTASFPNIIYLLAFDRERVEEALSEQRIPGREYLEKIILVAVDLPIIPSAILNEQTLKAIDAAVADIEDIGPFDQSVWPDVFMEIIRPLVGTMRDVRRYAIAIRGTARELGGQVALADVLALEAIRVLLPDVFARLRNSVDALTSTSDSYGSRADPPQLTSPMSELLKAAGEDEVVVRAMIQRLFPAAQRHLGGSHYGSDWKKAWLRERRVAHEDILRFYLERVTGEGLRAFNDAERAFSRMSDQAALSSYFETISPDRREDAVAALETYEDQYAPDQVVPASVVLLNLLPDLPPRTKGMFDLGTRMIVGRVVYRLVRSLKEPAAVEKAASEILPQVTSLGSKMELVLDLGHREGAGHKLVSETAARDLEVEWQRQVREASPDQLVRENDLLRVLRVANEFADDETMRVVVPDNPAVTEALLAAARTDVRSQTMGNRAIRREPRLAWEALASLFGSDEALVQRVESLRQNAAADPSLVQLAEKYASGWRPNDLRDD
jgi:KAP family P-loop domain